MASWAHTRSRLAGTCEFAKIAALRLEARKAFVHLDASRRLRAAALRKAAPVPRDYEVGDYVCYHKSKRGSESQWHGLARVVGRGREVVWLVHGGLPIAAAANKLRPAMAQEILTRDVISEYLRDVPAEPPEGFGDRGYVDLRDAAPVVDAAPDPNETAPEMHDEVMPAMRESSVEEPEMEQHEVQEAAQAAEQLPPAPESDEDADAEDLAVPDETRALPPPLTPLVAAMRRTRPDGQPMLGGSVLRVRRSAEEPAEQPPATRPRVVADPAVAAALGAATAAGVAGFFARRADFANRVKARTAREAKGKELNYVKCDPAQQVAMQEARRHECETWQRYSSAKLISKSEAEGLLKGGDGVILPTRWVEVDKNEALRTEDTCCPTACAAAWP